MLVYDFFPTLLFFPPCWVSLLTAKGSDSCLAFHGKEPLHEKTSHWTVPGVQNTRWAQGMLFVTWGIHFGSLTWQFTWTSKPRWMLSQSGPQVGHLLGLSHIQELILTSVHPGICISYLQFHNLPTGKEKKSQGDKIFYSKCDQFHCRHGIFKLQPHREWKSSAVTAESLESHWVHSGVQLGRISLPADKGKKSLFGITPPLLVDAIYWTASIGNVIKTASRLSLRGRRLFGSCKVCFIRFFGWTTWRCICSLMTGTAAQSIGNPGNRTR